MFIMLWKDHYFCLRLYWTSLWS